jgi:hypothetical protein
MMRLTGNGNVFVSIIQGLQPKKKKKKMRFLFLVAAMALQLLTMTSPTHHLLFVKL